MQVADRRSQVAALLPILTEYRIGMRSRPERQMQAAGRRSQVADAVAAGPERDEDELDDAVLLAMPMPTAAGAAAAPA